jgi:hypothetical protein
MLLFHVKHAKGRRKLWRRTAIAIRGREGRDDRVAVLQQQLSTKCCGRQLRAKHCCVSRLRLSRSG